MNTINVNREIGKLNRNYKYFDEKVDTKMAALEYPEYRSK
jgi:hypothetical protein